ncbi:MAG: CARDB domain-containing protein [Candidatus Bathyarchaeia archaeon]
MTRFHVKSNSAHNCRWNRLCGNRLNTRYSCANVTLLKTVVGEGYTMNINVTVINQGDFMETFNVAVYANTTEIRTKEITLQSGESTTLTFTWNTTDFAKGNYTLCAYAWPV